MAQEIVKDPLEESSEDECLSDLKRKIINNRSDNDKRTKYNDSSDKRPGVFVSVKVEKLDDSNKSSDNDLESSTKPEKKKSKVSKKKLSTENNLTSSDEKAQSGKPEEKIRHNCDQCARSFTTAFSLKRHKRNHIYPPAKCPKCDLTFTLNIELKRHLVSHSYDDNDDNAENKDTYYVKIKTEDGKQETVAIEKKRDTDTTRNVGLKIEIELVSNRNNNPNGIFRREELTNLTQCAIVSKMQKGKSVADICRLYNLTPNVVNEIWKDRANYVIPKNRQHTAKYMNSVIDRKVVDWFNEQRETDIQISGKMLQDVADMYAKECGFIAFTGCKRWLDRFKKKYNIALRTTPVKRDYQNLALECKWKKQFFKETWCDVRVGINNEDIYTADEVGLFYNTSKGRIKKFGGKKFVQGQVKDRMSIFVCTNVTGTDKKKLLVCGTEDPLLHSNRDPDTLPVTYIRQSKAHFTTEIFEEYVKYWNRELEAEDRTVLLIIDRATIHTKLKLSNLKLVFVPWKASIGLIPIKCGIYRRLRYEYRKLLLEDKAINVLRGFDRNVTCLEALYMLEKAWDRVTPPVIYKSFETIGYDIEECDMKPVKRFGVAENDEEVLCDLLKDFDVESYFTSLLNLDMYLTVDDEYIKAPGTNVIVYGGVRKTAEQMDEDSQGEVLPIGSDRFDSIDEDLVTRARAFEDVDTVRRYLQSQNTTYETFCSLMDVESFLLRSSFNMDVIEQSLV